MKDFCERQRTRLVGLFQKAKSADTGPLEFLSLSNGKSCAESQFGDRLHPGHTAAQGKCKLHCNQLHCIEYTTDIQPSKTTYLLVLFMFWSSSLTSMNCSPKSNSTANDCVIIS